MPKWTSAQELNTKGWYRLIKVIYIIIFVLLLLFGNFIFVFSQEFQQIDNNTTKINCTLSDKSFNASDLFLYLHKWNFPKGYFFYPEFFKNSNQWDIKTIIEKCAENESFEIDNIYNFQKTIELITDPNNSLYNAYFESETIDDQKKYNLKKALSDNKNNTKELVKIFQAIVTKYPELVESIDVEENTMNMQLEELKNETYDTAKLKHLTFSVELFHIIPTFTYIPFILALFTTNILILVLFEIGKRTFYYVVLGTITPKKLLN